VWWCDPKRWWLCADLVQAWRGSRSSVGERAGAAAPRWLAVGLETGSLVGSEMGSPVGSGLFFLFF
jgi:hypothetical protein